MYYNSILYTESAISEKEFISEFQSCTMSLTAFRYGPINKENFKPTINISVPLNCSELICNGAFKR